MLAQFDGVSAGEEVEERLAPTRDRTEPEQPESSGGLIHADDLPRASEALATLFPEDQPEEQAETPDVLLRYGAQEKVPLPLPEQPPQRKRRGLFSWLFSSSDTKDKQPDKMAVEARASVSKESEAGATPESQLIPEATKDVAVGTDEAATTQALIPTEELPSVNEGPAEIFPPEQEPATSITSTDGTESARCDALGEASTKTTPNRSGDGTSLPEELPQNENSIDSAATEGAAIAQVSEASVDAAQEELPTQHDSTEQTTRKASNGESTDEISTEPNSPEAPRRAPYRDWALDDKLASHREWVESHGRSGNRADLSGAELEGADLISVNLRLADLHDANLRAADMLLADLRDACLVRTDLEESCLVGANLEGANLEGATLETAMGLVPRQLAGANLRDALLTPQLMEFDAATKFARNARLAYKYFTAMTAVSLLSWLLIGKTSDAQLVTDSAVLPFLHSHAAAAALPTAESYLIIPAALFIGYLLFHFHLQQLWEAVQELPAIFPDGHELGDDQPSIIAGLLRTHFRWMNPDPSSSRLVERALALLLAYGLVPITLLLFWARYLTRQEIHGTLLQAALTAVATGIATYATTKVGRRQERWELEGKWSHKLVGRVREINPVKVAAILGGVLLFLSAGTIAGVPHERSRAAQYGLASVRRWAPTVFASLGYDPYPDLTEKSLSVRPSSWNVPDDQVQSVDGVKLNGAKLRYAQGYGIFLANAHLLHSDLQGAFFSQADLRDADLGQSNLRSAIMDQARMRGVNLDRSNLTGADLRRADLRGANLSHCKLENSILADAHLDGASLYGSHLDGATLNRANLEKADMREALMSRTHMDHADLQGAFLWSAIVVGADLGGAQFGGAILIDANLQGANLGGAQLGAAVLNNTILRDTSLQGADLRGALGLTAAQVCSAKSRRGARMDDAVAMEVQALCGLQ